MRAAKTPAAVLGLAVMAAGCGAASSEPSLPRRQKDRSPDAPSVAGPGGSRRADVYADTPLTALASDATDFALAVAAGRSPTSTALALQPGAAGPEAVYPDGRPRGTLQPRAALIRLDARFASAVGDGGAPARWVVGVVVGAEGLRLVQLEPRAEAGVLAGVDAFAQQMAEGTRAVIDTVVQAREAISTFPRAPGQEFLDASMAGALRRIAPALDEVRARLRGRRVQRVGLEDFAVIARDAAGSPWLLELAITVSDGRAVIRSNPALRVVALSGR